MNKKGSPAEAYTKKIQEELELETDHPTESLIQFALSHYGWIVFFNHGVGWQLVHHQFRDHAAQWKMCVYQDLNLTYPNWFKHKLLEQIKERANSMQEQQTDSKLFSKVWDAVENRKDWGLIETGIEDTRLLVNTKLPITHYRTVTVEWWSVLVPDWFESVYDKESAALQQTGQGWAEPDELPENKITQCDWYKIPGESNTTETPKGDKGLTEIWQCRNEKQVHRFIDSLKDTNWKVWMVGDNYKVVIYYEAFISTQEPEQFKEDVGMNLDEATKTLAQIQNEVYDWAMQFEDNPSHDVRFHRLCTNCDGLGKTPTSNPKVKTAWDEDKVVCSVCKGKGTLAAKLNSLPPLMGMCEELGELQGATCKRHQGRGFTDDQEYRGEVMDCLADIMIFMCDYANREGVDLTSNLERVWDKVKNRQQKTWVEDKSKEEPNKELAGPSLHSTLEVKNPEFLSEEEINDLKNQASEFWGGQRKAFEGLQDKADLMDEDVFEECDHEDPDRSGFCIKCQLPWEDWGDEDPLKLGITPEVYKGEPVARELDNDEKIELGLRLVQSSNWDNEAERKQLYKSVLVIRLQHDSEDLLLQPTDEDLLDRLIETIDNSDLWEESNCRKQLYKSVSAIGLQYGDQNLTNIEEGLLKQLMNVAVEAEDRLHGKDAEDIRIKLNDIRKLRPDILGEQMPSLKKTPKIDYGDDPIQPGRTDRT